MNLRRTILNLLHVEYENSSNLQDLRENKVRQEMTYGLAEFRKEKEVPEQRAFL